MTIAVPCARAHSRMGLHTDAPAARKALKRLDEFSLGHRARGQEDGISLKSVDDGGGADECAEQRRKVAEYEQAEKHGEM